MERTIPVTLLLLAGLLTPFPSAPASPAEEGSTTLFYTPSTPDGKAFYFKVRMNEATQCMRYTYRAEMDFGQPLPWWAFDFSGGTILVDGREVPLGVSDRFYMNGGGGIGQHFPGEDTGHHRVNVSVGGMTVYETSEEKGYDEKANTIAFSVTTAVCDIDCRSAGFQRDAAACDVLPRLDTVGTWMAIIMTPHVRNASVTFDFYETYDGWNFTGTHGDARGWLTFASDSNRTFLKQLKDFEGTFSYNGDPFDTGLGPSAAGANLETRINVERGMIGVFTDLPADPSTTLVSYEGPDAHVGISLDHPLHLTPTRQMAEFRGPAGDWTFRVHAHSDPVDHSWLFLWGADINIE